MEAIRSRQAQEVEKKRMSAVDDPLKALQVPFLSSLRSLISLLFPFAFSCLFLQSIGGLILCL